jgi:DNA/RNA-binding domain of Phe-tRNA-synthetase-like protein
VIAFSVDSRVFTRFPALSVAALAVSELDRAASCLSARDLDRSWCDAASELRERGITVENFSTTETIRQWNEVYDACRVPSSPCARGLDVLVRELLTTGRPVAQVPIASLYCAIAVRHLAPIGGCDAAALPHNAIALRPAHPESDLLVPLAARTTDVPLHSDAIVYAAGRVILRWFNALESRQTSIGRDTTRAVFFSEALSPAQASAAADALAELRDTLAARGARAGETRIVDLRTPDVLLWFEDEVEST